LEFEWDDDKDRGNREKHGIGFEEAALIFEGLTLSKTDDRKDYGEIRTITLGQLAEQVVVVVVHTDRNGRIRLVSARLANRMERKEYNDYRSKIN
jgi:uncharacterized DUF497 family protein